MDYNKIANKYTNADIKDYKFANALEVKKVLGYDFRTIRGFKALSDGDKVKAERLICRFLNGHGLEAREGIRPTKIKRESGKFTLHYGKKYSYLYDGGSVG
ncbi:hypothetical protein [Clostridium sp. CF012]|uniref:hypothetical protein n=1 Tax=Clostridium sp. CF012 TaxID=2843319 RepID=UPI001C0E17D0|nr:hypothetical protein [Clostridium sp. CF012]MBU3145758.1 hypothetical protein [Clostridium sp. CF012]